jgi:predicted negative regulator of RcsB-dependent stress response
VTGIFQPKSKGSRITMSCRWTRELVLLLCAIAVCPVSAAEPYLKFAQRLRDRGYHDTAVTYLEELETRSNLPPAIREVIPYEKAISMIQGARRLRSPDLQAKELEKARLFLEQFLKSSPNHAQAGSASTELGNVWIAKARAEAGLGRLPDNAAQAAEFQGRAREYLDRGRKIFQEAHDQYKKAFEKFAVFIPQTEKAKIDAREQALIHYIQSQLNLAIASYEAAQTHEKESRGYADALGDAAKEFEQIHSRYRDRNAGLYARMWQGKCYEEQDEVTKALGIYNELLSHPVENNHSLKAIHDRTTLFKLICLNHPKRKEYQAAIDEANAWRKANPTETRTQLGLGILFELAHAQELMAEADETAASEKRRLRTAALANAREVNKFPGEYKELSKQAIQRISVQLGQDLGDFKDFASLLSMAQEKIAKLGGNDGLRRRVANETDPAAKRKADEDLARHLQETAKVLKDAVGQVRSDTEPARARYARYLQAFVELERKRYYDAAILGEHLARRHVKDDPNVALNCAHIALLGWQAAFRDSPEQDKPVDVARLLKLGDFVAAKFPIGEKVGASFLVVGDVLTQLQRPADAAVWYGKVSENAAEYLEAKLKAGQAYWAAYYGAAALPEAERPSPEMLQEYQETARKMLQDARGTIDRMDAKLPQGAPPTEDITRAKLSLATILNGSGESKQAVDVLASGPRAVTVAVTVDAGEFRPAVGVKSRSFASEVYRQLLWAYVGAQETEKAQVVMKELERIEEGTGKGMNEVYLSLGRQLQRRVEQLTREKSSLLGDLLSSFELFLENVARRPDQDFNMQRWVGETYYALASGLGANESQRAERYFKAGATVLASLLNKVAREPGFALGQPLDGIKLRLSACQRRLKQYDEAYKLIAEVLKAKNQALDAQIEAATLYQEWAEDGGPQQVEKWDVAVAGERPDAKGFKVVWGWMEIGKRLRLKSSQSARGADESTERQYIEANYNVAYCTYRSALAQTTLKKKRPVLERAQRHIFATSSLSEDLGGVEWWEKFNKLYRDVQKELSVDVVTDLPRHVRTEAPPPTVTEDTESSVAKTDGDSTAKSKAAKAASGSKPGQKSSGTGAIIGFLVLLLAGGGIGGYISLTGRKSHRIAKPLVDEPPIELVTPTPRKVGRA